MNYEDIQKQARSNIFVSLVKKYPNQTPKETIDAMNATDIYNLCEEISKQSFEVGRLYERQQKSESNSEVIKEYLTQQLNSFN